jgi:hypothetical protein
MNWFDDAFSVYKQLILLIIALILLFLYYNKAFKNEDYNTLCLVYSVFILLWLGTIIIRFVFLHYYPMPRMGKPIIEVPYGMKCYFGQKDCENGDFTIFTIFHLISYIVVGYVVPGYYLEIFVISILCELLEYGMGFEAKYLLDPLVNEIGYVIGSNLRYLVNDIRG